MKTVTRRRLEKILGYSISCTGGNRQYTIVDGVAYVDAFTGDVDIEQPHKKAFNGEINGMEYFNEIIFTGKCIPKTIELDLAWGSKCLNKELEELTKWLENNTATDKLDDAGIRTKKIEDFSVSFSDSEETTASTNNALLDTFGFYIRRPLIVGVTSDHRNNERYF